MNRNQFVSRSISFFLSPLMQFPQHYLLTVTDYYRSCVIVSTDSVYKSRTPS